MLSILTVCVTIALLGVDLYCTRCPVGYTVQEEYDYR